jgi:hypothetical protein
MNELERSGTDQADTEAGGRDGSQGPNLTLLYSLIAVALVTAIAIAVMIVLPFYHRH